MAKGIEELRAEAQAACAAWGIELERAFGKQRGTARYQKRGEGEPGTPLRERYEAFQKATKAMADAAHGSGVSS